MVIVFVKIKNSPVKISKMRQGFVRNLFPHCKTICCVSSVSGGFIWEDAIWWALHRTSQTLLEYLYFYSYLYIFDCLIYFFAGYRGSFQTLRQFLSGVLNKIVLSTNLYTLTCIVDCSSIGRTSTSISYISISISTFALEK